MSSKPVHPKDRDKPDGKAWRKERARRRREAQVRRAERNLQDEQAARRKAAQMQLDEEN